MCSYCSVKQHQLAVVVMSAADGCSFLSWSSMFSYWGRVAPSYKLPQSLQLVAAPSLVKGRVVSLYELQQPLQVLAHNHATSQEVHSRYTSSKCAYHAVSASILLLGRHFCCTCSVNPLQVFNALHAMGYEWVIRLDHDSEVPSTIPYNIVDQMIQHKAQYGFRAFNIDHARVVYALPDAARYWIVSQMLNPADLWLMDFFKNSGLGLNGMSSDNYDLRIIYNNFFVSNVTWWMEPKVQGWLRYLEMLRGYHKFRWGDAPVHLFTTAMHLKKEQMLEFDFEYKHQHYYKMGDYGSRYPDRNVVYDGLPRLNSA